MFGKKNKFKFRAKLPDLAKYIGKTVKIDGKDVVIDTLQGNLGKTLGRSVKDIRPQYYEINGQYLISMLRFHAQMEGAHDITEEQFKQFEEIEFFSEKVGDEGVTDVEGKPIH